MPSLDTRELEKSLRLARKAVRRAEELEPGVIDLDRRRKERNAFTPEQEQAYPALRTRRKA